MAVSADGEDWFLLNASPEIRAQIESFPPLHPRRPRHSPIVAVLLTNGDLDHCLGLLSLRESYPITVYATDRVRRGFSDGNAIYRTLERFPGHVTWKPLVPGREVQLAGADGGPAKLAVRPVAVPGKPPVHLIERFAPDPEDNVGFLIRDLTSDRVIAYFSGVAAVTPAVLEALRGVECVFFDGTFWSDDELIALGLGDKRAQDMAHVPIGGGSGSLAALADCAVGRRIYIHINNTNPILREDSPERIAVESGGWTVARDGMEFDL